MRKLLFCAVLILWFGAPSSLSAQMLYAYTPTNSRMVVDGVTDYLVLKKKRRQEAEIRHSLHGCLFIALDGQGTGFYGANYNFAYPIKSFVTSGLYIAANPSLGGSASANSQSGGSFEFGVDLPIMLEYHMGEADAFGGVFGAGFSYNFINSSYSSIPHKALGPAVNAGVQVPIAGKVYCLKANFLLNLNKKTVGTGSDVYSTGNIVGLTAGIVF